MGACGTWAMTSPCLSLIPAQCDRSSIPGCHGKAYGSLLPQLPDKDWYLSWSAGYQHFSIPQVYVAGAKFQVSTAMKLGAPFLHPSLLLGQRLYPRHGRSRIPGPHCPCPSLLRGQGFTLERQAQKLCSCSSCCSQSRNVTLWELCHYSHHQL